MDEDYEMLGVSPSASLEDIQEAYRKALNDNHPNRNGTFDGERVNKLKAANKRIIEKIKAGAKKTIMNEKKYDHNIAHTNLNVGICPTMNQMCDNLDWKLANYASTSNTTPYYSKLAYFVKRDGKVYKKLQENINGNLREYEECSIDNTNLNIF
uniref:J domain-containing protein n=1 Tax=Pyramimonas orientalis virus TaxID=455367 RepID=A0A7M3UP42_POV01|nr:hypothetical protein HWQ62_00368 [Pyramimonas orientalis virus]